MNCYIHPEVEAVGVCRNCGQGVCEACAVKIEGKLFCKSDVETAQIGRESVESERAQAPTIKAATIFFMVFGLVELLMGILLIYYGAYIGTQAANFTGMPIVSNFVGVASVSAILLGVFFVFLTALDILASYWLWGSERNGGTLGMVLSVCWIVVFGGISLVPAGQAFGIAGILVNTITLFLLITGWKDLT